MSQNDKVRSHLQRFGSITPLQALGEYGIMRLASRIDELRRTMAIRTVMKTRENKQGERVRFAEYILEKSHDQK